MKCPYRNFQECIVEQCPSCVYEKEEKVVIEGRCPSTMSQKAALEKGYIWESTKTVYKFVSCKLVDDKVQPVPEQKQIINNNQKTNVVIRKSIF